MRNSDGDGAGRTEPVVCGVAHDREASAAVTVAEQLAVRLGVPLVLVHAALRPDVPDRPFSTLRERTAEQTAFERAGHQQLVLEPIEVDVRIAVERSVEFGHPPDALRDVADRYGAALIVVCSRGRTGLARALLGSTSSALAARAPYPVVVVPPACTDETVLGGRQGIVCGVDGSPSARRAVDAAGRLAARLGMGLTLVHVMDDESDVAALDDARSIVRVVAPDVAVDVERVTGRPAERLLAAARSRSAGLLVVGSRAGARCARRCSAPSPRRSW